MGTAQRRAGTAGDRDTPCSDGFCREGLPALTVLLPGEVPNGPHALNLSLKLAHCTT